MSGQFINRIVLMRHPAVLAGIIILQMVGIVSAECYYIALAGSDKNTGSISEPWRTVGHAWKNSGGGDTVFVRGGIYSDKQIWLAANQHSVKVKTSFWTLISYPGEECVFVDTRFILDDDFIRIQGLKLTGRSFIQAVSWNGLHEHIEIIGNDLSGSTTVPIYFNANKGLVAENHIHPISAIHGIYVMHGDSNVIINNFISGIDKYGIHIYDEKKYDHPVKITNLRVEGNTVEESKSRSGIIISAGESIDYSIEIEGVVIRNNVVINNAEDGITIRYYGKVRNLEIIHNTIDGNKAYGLRISAKDVDQVTVKNNIFSSNKEHIFVSSRINSFAVSHNLYWPPLSSRLRALDSHPIFADPLFANKEKRNFKIQPGSPAIDAGIDTGLHFYGSAPDLGAFEFNLSAPSAKE